MIFILLGAGAPTHRTNAMEPPSASSVTEPSVIHQVRSTLIGYSANPTSIAALGYDGHVDAAGTPVIGVSGWANRAAPGKGEPAFVVPRAVPVIIFASRRQVRPSS